MEDRGGGGFIDFSHRVVWKILNFIYKVSILLEQRKQLCPRNSMALPGISEIARDTKNAFACVRAIFLSFDFETQGIVEILPFLFFRDATLNFY